jgi:hypothetical protein
MLAYTTDEVPRTITHAARSPKTTVHLKHYISYQLANCLLTSRFALPVSTQTTRSEIYTGRYHNSKINRQCTDRPSQNQYRPSFRLLAAKLAATEETP